MARIGIIRKPDGDFWGTWTIILCRTIVTIISNNNDNCNIDARTGRIYIAVIAGPAIVRATGPRARASLEPRHAGTGCPGRVRFFRRRRPPLPPLRAFASTGTAADAARTAIMAYQPPSRRRRRRRRARCAHPFHKSPPRLYCKYDSFYFIHFFFFASTTPPLPLHFVPQTFRPLRAKFKGAVFVLYMAHARAILFYLFFFLYTALIYWRVCAAETRCFFFFF